MSEGVQQQAGRCPRCDHMLYTATGQNRRYCIPCGWEDYSYGQQSELAQTLPKPFRPSRLVFTYAGDQIESAQMVVQAKLDSSRSRHDGGALYRVWCPFCQEEMSYSKFAPKQGQKTGPSRPWTFQDSVGHVLQVDVMQLIWW